MFNMGITEKDFNNCEDLEGRIFELYEKTPHREFKSHVQFIKAATLCEAEDLAAEADPSYWKNKSVRLVTLDYAWDVFTQLYYSYNMAKSVLGLDDFCEE